MPTRTSSCRPGSRSPATTRPTSSPAHLFFASYGEGAIHDLELNAARLRSSSDEIIYRYGRAGHRAGVGTGGPLLLDARGDRVVADRRGGAAREHSPTAGGAATTPEPTPSQVATEAGKTNRSSVGTLIAIAVPVLLLLGFLATRKPSGPCLSRYGSTTRDESAELPRDRARVGGPPGLCAVRCGV